MRRTFLSCLTSRPFHKNIGDKGVRSVADARRYIADVPVAHYRAYGYGAYLVCLRDSLQPIGMCGLYQRANLDKPDLGFALSQRFHGQGYAREASQAVLNPCTQGSGAFITGGDCRSGQRGLCATAACSGLSSARQFFACRTRIRTSITTKSIFNGRAGVLQCGSPVGIAAPALRCR